MGIGEVAVRAAEIEALAGFDAVGVTETNGNPFLAAAQAAQATSRVRVATAIALAFPRSPMEIAYAAWDLQALSGGRFALGLGSQVRAHVERRYSAVWSHPAARMREYVLAFRSDLGRLGSRRGAGLSRGVLLAHVDASELQAGGG